MTVPPKEGCERVMSRTARRLRTARMMAKSTTFRRGASQTDSPSSRRTSREGDAPKPERPHTRRPHVQSLQIQRPSMQHVQAHRPTFEALNLFDLASIFFEPQSQIFGREPPLCFNPKRRAVMSQDAQATGCREIIPKSPHTRIQVEPRSLHSGRCEGADPEGGASPSFPAGWPVRGQIRDRQEQALHVDGEKARQPPK